ncbi:MAG: hypothetical protein H6737_23925 [Alphaproteobacteria bacterium]|nr:hypothetical protein [Alphaproteobacteria bacterium]
MRNPLVLLLPSLLGGAGCATPPTELEAARALWLANGPTAYRFQIEPLPTCPFPLNYEVSVRAGVPSPGVPMLYGEPAEAIFDLAELFDPDGLGCTPLPESLQTIDSMLERLEDAYTDREAVQQLHAHPYDISVEFAPDLGYPREAYVNASPTVPSAAWGFTITDMRALQ